MIQEAKPVPLMEDESSLAARAAWLHPIGRSAQNEGAARLKLAAGRAPDRPLQAARATILPGLWFALLRDRYGRTLTAYVAPLPRIAERTNAGAHGLPVPFCRDSAEDRALLLQQRGPDEVLALARSSTLRFAGIGIVDAQAASPATSGMLAPQENRRGGPCGRPGRDPGPSLRSSRRPGRNRTVGAAHIAVRQGVEGPQARGGRGRNRQARSDPRRLVERAPARPSHRREDGSGSRRTETGVRRDKEIAL